MSSSSDVYNVIHVYGRSYSFYRRSSNAWHKELRVIRVVMAVVRPPVLCAAGGCVDEERLEERERSKGHDEVSFL